MVSEAKKFSAECVWRQSVSAPKRRAPICPSAITYRRQMVMAAKHLGAKTLASNHQRLDVSTRMSAPKRYRPEENYDAPKAASALPSVT